MPVGNPVTDLSGPGNYVPVTRTLTINGVTYDLSANRTWTVGVGSVSSVGLIMPTGFSVSNSPITSSGDLTVGFAAGYSLPTTAKQSQWDSAYSFTSTFPTGSAFQLLRYNTLGTALEFFTPSYLTPVDIIATTPLVWNSGTNTMSIPVANNTTNGYLSSVDWLTFSSKQPAITLTTTGNSGAATLIANTLNVPEYTLAGLGGMTNPMTGANGIGDIIYGNAFGNPTRRAPNVTTTKMFLSSTGDGTSGNAPIWEQILPSTIGAVPTSRQLTINGTAFDLTADRTWSVGTITSLTGEATASGSGAVAVTLTNSAVIGKVLTGLNVTGGTVIATDTILTAFGKLQNQVNGLAGGVTYQGGWNASTNSPALSSGTGTKGYYYVVTTAGSTNLDGITDWKLGDWAIYNGTVWEKVDNTDSVTSVNGFTGAVSLTTANISEATNLYYTDTRSRLAVSLTTTGSSGAATYNNTTGVFNIPQYTLTGLGGVPSSRQLTINGVNFDLTADRSWSVGTVTSVGLSTTTTGVTIGSTPVTTSGTITIDIDTASSTLTGLLSSTDWTNFNGKLNNPFLAIGDLVYSNSAGIGVRRSGNITTTKMYLSQTGDGTNSAAPQWSAITASDVGAVPTTRTLTINDVAFDLSSDRSWSVGDFGTW